MTNQNGQLITPGQPAWLLRWAVECEREIVRIRCCLPGIEERTIMSRAVQLSQSSLDQPDPLQIIRRWGRQVAETGELPPDMTDTKINA